MERASSNVASLDLGDRGAVLSEDGTYRYLLWRRWSDGPTVLFIMLNPSTADADVDDPTIRRCMCFARDWGYGGIHVWNLYSLRATDPAELDRAAEPIGHGNEKHLWTLLQSGQVGRIVAAWGAKPNRGAYKVRELMIRVGPLFDRPVYALGRTKEGHPRHPLYVRRDAELILYDEAGEPC